MKLSRYNFIFFIVTVAFATVTLAGGNYWEKRGDKQEIQQEKKELGTTSTTVKRLTHNIDLWVDANLKGHGKKADKYEQTIFELIEGDIASSRRLAERYEAEVRSSTTEYNRSHTSRAERRDDRADLRDDVKDLHRAWQFLKVKERLASSLHRTTAFSNKYRLFGDYAEVLRCELGMARVELAEDINEHYKDRVEGHRE